jgi:Tfp pilus assembly protein PilP
MGMHVTWKSGVLAAALAVSAPPVFAQVPNPTPALNAAKNARSSTETADQKPAPGDPKPATAAGTAAPPAADPNAPGAGYSYDPAGRRDPFVSLTARGGDVPLAAGARPGGVPGLLVGEVTVKGIFKSPKGGFLALLQAPDGRTYSVKQGDKVFDGNVKAITQDTVVFSQDVNDPLSLVKQREVRKSIRPEAR